MKLRSHSFETRLNATLKVISRSIPDGLRARKANRVNVGWFGTRTIEAIEVLDTESSKIVAEVFVKSFGKPTLRIYDKKNTEIARNISNALKSEGWYIFKPLIEGPLETVVKFPATSSL